MIRSKDNFLQVSDGAWIYFEDYGKDKGEPIMILHGFLCSSKFFYKNIDALSADHRLVLIDWRGTVLRQKRFKISLWTAVPRMFMNSLSIWAWRM